MQKQNVILTGFMGTGKTSTGRLLAEMLGYEFVDTDTVVEAIAGQPISTIFATEGEEAFRALERDVATSLAERTGVVIATGGRLMLDEENATILTATGPVFCLTAAPETLVERLRGDGGQRPLLAVPEPAARIAELLAERAEGYGRFPQVDTSKFKPDEVARLLAVLVESTMINVTYPYGSYPAVVGQGLLPELRQLAAIDGPIVIITDSNVGPRYAAACGQVAAVLTMPAGEPHKTLKTVSDFYDQLLAAGIDRQATLVALGGGVVGDVAGFVAATYMRGLDFVQCPTSLLAMVDASVGAKTGVDLPQGKNLVGAFKQPTAVLVDLGTLQTLPAEEFASGMAEVIKSAIIGDPQLFAQLEQQPSLRKPEVEADWAAVGDMVTRAIEVKRAVVQDDPFEQGRRAVLNLGHTFGHAIEQVSGYTVRHGEAVAMGMIAAAYMAAALGYAEESLGRRIASLLDKADLPQRIPVELEAVALLAAMGSDKKKADGRLRFVLPRDVGDVFIVTDIADEAVLATLVACGAG